MRQCLLGIPVAILWCPLEDFPKQCFRPDDPENENNVLLLSLQPNRDYLDGVNALSDCLLDLQTLRIVGRGILQLHYIDDFVHIQVWWLIFGYTYSMMWFMRHCL